MSNSDMAQPSGSADNAAAAVPVPYAALLARLEAATGPDRGLDDAIHDAVGTGSPCPPYTASESAALKLVPASCEFEFWSAKLVDTYGGRCVSRDAEYQAKAKTLPLAICKAALMARAAA